MPRRPLPLRAVTGLFLERQHLTRPRARPLSARRLVRFVEDVGGIQMDSINVLDRAHYLTVWSRFGAYDRALLDRLVYRRRLLFEYWAHAACLVPISALPWWRRAMLDYRIRHTGWSDWLRRNPKTLAQVEAAIRANGPMGNADFEGRRRPGATGWWTWRPTQHALHYLWMTGALTIHSRRHFHKRFDLMERALPAVADCEPVSAQEFARWHVERSLHAMGAATDADLAGYLTFPRAMTRARRAALEALRERGEVTTLEVEGRPERWLALTRDLPALARAARTPVASRGTTFLAPFDSLLWYRGRVARLFGFDYRIEVYTPGPRRVHGYYTLPILHDGQLIGRLDAKAHRAERRLEVRHVHFEPWLARGHPSPRGARVDQDEAVGGVAEALRSLATFVGADETTLRRVTPHRVRARLARALLGVALCLLGAVDAGRVWGDEIVGRRMFSDQQVVPEPFVEDELSVAAFAAGRGRNVRDREPVVTRSAEIEVKKRITTELEVSLTGALADVDRGPDPGVTGFENLEVGLKYQFLTDPSREAVGSVALTWDVGGTGRAAAGATPFDVLHPALLFGKGFGELTERVRWLAPLAVTAFVGAAIPTRASEPNVLEWGAVVEYSLPYLRSIAPTASLPAALRQTVPIAELDFQTGLDRGSGGKTTGTANIGAIWIGRGFQIGLEAVVPVNDRTGTTAGARAFLRIELERVIGAWGRPLFGHDADE